MPDICIHSKQLDGRQAYINWVNKNIFNDSTSFIFAKFRDNEIISIGTSKKEYQNEKYKLLPNESLLKTTSLNGKILYALKCSYLHEGTLNINFGKYPINIKLKLGILESLTGYPSNFIFGINKNKEIYAKIDILYLCNQICEKVKLYYKVHKKDFKDLLSIQDIEIY